MTKFLQQTYREFEIQSHHLLLLYYVLGDQLSLLGHQVVVGRPPRHLPQDQSGAVHVRPQECLERGRAHVLVQHLGRHVADGADALVGRAVVHVVLVALEAHREAKVGDGAGPVALDEDVPRLDVTVGDGVLAVRPLDLGVEVRQAAGERVAQANLKCRANSFRSDPFSF